MHEIQKARVIGGHLGGWLPQDLLPLCPDSPRAGKRTRQHSDTSAMKGIQSGSDGRMKNHLKETQGHPGGVTPDYRTSITQDKVLFQTAGEEMKLIGLGNSIRWLQKRF